MADNPTNGIQGPSYEDPQRQGAHPSILETIDSSLQALTTVSQEQKNSLEELLGIWKKRERDREEQQRRRQRQRGQQQARERDRERDRRRQERIDERRRLAGRSPEDIERMRERGRRRDDGLGHHVGAIGREVMDLLGPGQILGGVRTLLTGRDEPGAITDMIRSTMHDLSGMVDFTRGFFRSPREMMGTMPLIGGLFDRPEQPTPGEGPTETPPTTAPPTPPPAQPETVQQVFEQPSPAIQGIEQIAQAAGGPLVLSHFSEQAIAQLRELFTPAAEDTVTGTADPTQLELPFFGEVDLPDIDQDKAERWGNLLFGVPDEDALAVMGEIDGYKPLLARDDGELETLADRIEAIRDAFMLGEGVSLLDEDISVNFRILGEGVTAIMKAMGEDPAATERATEAFVGFFINVNEIPEEALDKLERITGFVTQTALGLVAMAGALFVVAAVPAGPALAGVGVIAAALGVVGLAGMFDNEIQRGSLALILAGVGMAGVALAMDFVADIDPVDSLAGLGVIAAAGGIAALAGAGASLIISGAAALALLAPSMALMGWAMDMVTDFDPVSALANLGVITVAGGVGVLAGIAAPLIIPGAAALAILGVGLLPIAFALEIIGDIDHEEAMTGVNTLFRVTGLGIFAGVTAPLIMLGSTVLPVLGTSLFFTSVMVREAMQQFARVADDGIPAFEHFLTTVTTFSQEVDPVNLMFGIIQLPLLSGAIITAGFALRFLREDDVENFSTYVEALIQLASMDNIGPRLREAAEGIQAINDVMATDNIFDTIRHGMESAIDTMNRTVDFFDDAGRAIIEMWTGVDMQRAGPFDMYIELGRHEGLGQRLAEAADGIDLVNQAMADETWLDSLERGFGRLIELAADGLFGGPDDPLNLYRELAAMGPELRQAGLALEGLAQAFQDVEDFDQASIMRGAEIITDFIDSVGRDNLRLLGEAGFTVGGQPIEVTEEARQQWDVDVQTFFRDNPRLQPDMTFDDVLIQSDGTVIGLNPEDNVYATVNELQVHESETHTEHVPMVDMEPTNHFLSENEQTLGFLAQTISDLREELQELRNSMQERQRVVGPTPDPAAPTIITINKGYNNESLLETTV